MSGNFAKTGKDSERKRPGTFRDAMYCIISNTIWTAGSFMSSTRRPYATVITTEAAYLSKWRSNIVGERRRSIASRLDSFSWMGRYVNAADFINPMWLLSTSVHHTCTGEGTFYGDVAN